jgi:hypothetical protein
MTFWIHLISHTLPINPTPRPYHRVTCIYVPCVTWEAVTFVGTTHCRGLLNHKLTNGALAYAAQGGKYRAEGCMAQK